MAIESVGIATNIPQQTRLDQSTQTSQAEQSRQAAQVRQTDQTGRPDQTNGTPDNQPPQPVVNALGQVTGKVVNTVA